MGKELFSNIPRKVGDLINDVKIGRIGLPDLQRPFVWKDNKVRDLLDSMLKGFPIGYIMLWESPSNYDRTNQIGGNEKEYREPDDLVIDGQQRLTALLAAMEGVKIKDKNYKERNIKISYNPLTRDFQVWSQAYERSAEYISAVSDVFAADKEHSITKFRTLAFIKSNKNKYEIPIGSLFIEYLYFYSNFNFYNTVIQPKKDNNIFENIEDNNLQKYNLNIIDPITGLNVAKSTFKIDQIQIAFKKGFENIISSLIEINFNGYGNFNNDNNNNKEPISILENFFSLKY